VAKRKQSESVDSRSADAANTGGRSALEPVRADAVTSALPAGHPLVAAYRAGRATNQFWWAAQQAVLLPPGLGSSQRLAAQQALVELRANIILTVKAPDREALRDHVTDLLDGFQSWLDSESYSEDVFMRTERLKRLASGWEFDLERSSAIEDLTLQLRHDRDQLLKLIPPALGPQEESAFRLGYVLDQGLRPPSVCEHLLAPPEQSTELPAIAWAPSARPDEGSELPLTLQRSESSQASRSFLS